MKSLLLIGALALLPLAGASAQTSAAPPSAQYILLAGQSDQFEIQSGRLAATKATSADLRKFGDKMVTDHTKSTELVVNAAKKSGAPVGPPPSLRVDQQSLLTQLEGESGAAFDKAYLSQQLAAHKEALGIQTSYASSGEDENLKRAANKIVPVVKMHLSMLRKMSMHR